VTAVVSRFFASVRQLRQTRRSAQAAAFQMLTVAMVHSRLDHGNAVLSDLQDMSSICAECCSTADLSPSTTSATDALVSLHYYEF